MKLQKVVTHHLFNWVMGLTFMYQTSTNQVSSLALLRRVWLLDIVLL